MSPGTIIHVKRKTGGRGSLGWRHIADLQPVRLSSPSMMMHPRAYQPQDKKEQKRIILQSVRSIRATIMKLSTNNDYNNYFGAELDDLIGNLEEDNERLLFADFDDDGAAEMDVQLDKTDHPCDDDDDDSVLTSSIVTPMKEKEDRAPTPCLSRPHREQEERQQSFQRGADAVDNFNPSTQHYHQQQQHITHPRQSESCSGLSMSSHSMQSSTAAAPPIVNTFNQDVNVNHQGIDSKSSSFQQEEHPYPKVQYDRALQNLAESMKRTEVSRRQIMMHKRTEMTRRHVTMARGMLSHEQQRALHLAKMQLNQQQQQVQQAHHHQNQLQQQTLPSPMVASFFNNSSATRGSRSSFANTVDQGRKRFSMYLGQVNHSTL